MPCQEVDLMFDSERYTCSNSGKMREKNYKNIVGRSKASKFYPNGYHFQDKFSTTLEKLILLEKILQGSNN